MGELQRQNVELTTRMQLQEKRHRRDLQNSLNQAGQARREAEATLAQVREKTLICRTTSTNGRVGAVPGEQRPTCIAPVILSTTPSPSCLLHLSGGVC